MPISLYGEGPNARAVVIRNSPLGVGNPVVRIANQGFRARTLTIENYDSQPVRLTHVRLSARK